MRKPNGVTGLEISTAYENIARLEAATGGVIDDLLTRLRVCGGCGHPRERHTSDGPCGRCVGALGEPCRVFEWSVTVGEIVQSLTYMKAMTRHEQRVDADLGLDVKKVAVVGSPIAEMLEAAGYTVEDMKRMSASERADKVLEVTRAVGIEGPVQEAEVVAEGDTHEEEVATREPEATGE